jgi:hypothetical protein
MCALCGLFEGESHWSDAVRVDRIPMRQARLRRVALANRVLQYYGLTLSDWQGSKYLLSAATGATEIIDNVAGLWPAAERLLRRPCDPLDRGLIDALDRAGSREAGR